MNIALIFPPFYLEAMYNLPPLGLINLATVLKPSAHRVRIFDFPLAIRQKTVPMDRNIYRECAAQIMRFEPDAAGFSVQCTTYPPALRIAEELKKSNPQLKIVFGGHNASCTDELTLSRFPFIDAVVRGEGEITFPELIRAFEGRIAPESVDGVTFRRSGRIVRNPDRKLIESLDSLPVSDYAFAAPFHEYRDACGIGRSIAVLEVGRGCPHRCIYCSQSIMWRRRARTFSTERIIGEIGNLAQNHGAECFLLAFDQFTAKRSFVERFCRGMMDAGLNGLPWYCISRLDTVDKDLLTLMHTAGCETMCYGIDSGSKKTLAFIRKEIDRDILFDRVRETTQAGISPTLSFVIGFPEESRQDLEETLLLALKCAATGNANILVQMATILPGTDLYEKYRERLVREVDTYFSLGIEFDGGKRIPSDDALIDSDPTLFCSFHNVPSPAAPLMVLNETANCFTVMAAVYPRSLFLLGLELNRPVLDLFLDFLDRAQETGGEASRAEGPAAGLPFIYEKPPERPGREGGKAAPPSARLQRRLTLEACLAHFGRFAAESLAGHDPVARDFMAEIVKYETRLIEAGGERPARSPLPAGPSGAGGPKLLRREKILLERFTFDIPHLILEFKCGHFSNARPQRAVYIAFTRGTGGAEALEINEFGYDFLQLCNGRWTIREIANLLYPKYGANRERDEFAAMCAEAAGTLLSLELLFPFSPA